MKTLLIIAILLGANLVCAQTPGKTFVAISVADADQTARWYEENLGFKEVRRSEAPNKLSRAVILDSQYGMLEIIQHKQAVSLELAAPKVKDTYLIHGIFKVGFFVEGIDDLYATLKKRPIEFVGGLYTDEPLNLKSFIIRDNNGIVVQFLQRMPPRKS